MARKRTKEQNAAIYQRRKQRAITEGYKGYGQKKYRQDKTRRARRADENRESKVRRVQDLIRRSYPDSMFDSSGWLDRDATDREIKRALRATERKHGVHFDDAEVNRMLFDETARWANFRTMYERMMGWAA